MQYMYQWLTMSFLPLVVVWGHNRGFLGQWRSTGWDHMGGWTMWWVVLIKIVFFRNWTTILTCRIKETVKLNEKNLGSMHYMWMLEIACINMNNTCNKQYFESHWIELCEYVCLYCNLSFHGDNKMNKKFQLHHPVFIIELIKLRCHKRNSYLCHVFLFRCWYL